MTIPSRLAVQVTHRQLEDCKRRQQHVLQNLIREPNAPPADGDIAKIMNTLWALEWIDPALSEIEPDSGMPIADSQRPAHGEIEAKATIPPKGTQTPASDSANAKSTKEGPR